MDEEDIGVFESAVRNIADVTDSFFIDCGQPQLRLTEVDEERYCQSIREVMLGYSGGAMPLLADVDLDQARNLLAQGMVAAVDGTDVLTPTNFIGSGIFACAIGHVTSHTRGNFFA